MDGKKTLNSRHSAEPGMLLEEKTGGFFRSGLIPAFTAGKCYLLPNSGVFCCDLPKNLDKLSGRFTKLSVFTGRRSPPITVVGTV